VVDENLSAAPADVDDAVSDLSLTASAIAGRRVRVVRTSGAAVHTDRTTICVPASLPSAERFSVVAVHAGLLACGADDPHVIKSLRSGTRVSARYFALEWTRARRELAALLPGSLPDFDQPRIDTASPSESFAVARGEDPVTVLPEHWGEMKPGRHSRTSRSVRAGSGSVGGEESRLDEDESGDAAEDSLLMKLTSTPFGGRNFFARLFASLAGTTSTVDAAGGAQLDRVSRHVNGRPRSPAPMVRGIPVAPMAERPRGWSDRPRARYDEWNEYKKAYRPCWSSVYEHDLPGTASPIAHSRLNQRLGRTQFELRRSRFEPHGDDVDIDAAIDARIDMRSRRYPDGRVYVARRRLGRDLGVLVLLDCSGSTADPAGSSGTIFDVQVQAAAQLAERLEAHGDRVAVYGFNSRGRENVHLYAVKSFDSRWSANTRSRLGELRAAGFTRMGAAIRHGATILTERSHATRELLVVISDGVPYDDDYEGRYASADTKRALAEARQAGIGCLCLSLGGTASADSLEAVFGAAAFGRAPNLGGLGGRIHRLFDEALMAAERAQRQRRFSDEGVRESKNSSQGGNR
jgi:nitric oxide reductase NorD protein